VIKGLSCVYGDPDELDRLAGQLRARAEEVRGVARDHERQTAAAHWVSASADALRARVADDSAAAHDTADQMDAAAETLVQHAQTVRERIAELTAAAEAAREWAEQQLRRGGELLEDVVDEGMETARDVGAAVQDAGAATLRRMGLLD